MVLKINIVHIGSLDQFKYENTLYKTDCLYYSVLYYYITIWFFMVIYASIIPIIEK